MEKFLHPSLKKSLYILLVSIVMFASCKEEATEISFPLPELYFTFDESYAYVDEEISFNNGSENSTSYTWDFGDGVISSEENPKHAYVSEGEYIITLTAVGEGGEVSEKSTTIIKNPSVQGKWVLQEAYNNEEELLNVSGYFHVTDAENYSAEFIDGKNTGKATAKFTQFSPLFLSNIDSRIAIINGRSTSGTSSMQLWSTEIFCNKTVYTNYLMTGLGIGKPELSFEGRYLVLVNGNAKLKYSKE